MKKILLVAIFQVLLAFCLNANASDSFKALFVADELIVAPSNIDEVYMKYAKTKDEYLVIIKLNESGQDLFEKAFKKNEKRKVMLIFDQTVLTIPLPIHSDTIGEIGLTLKDEKTAIKLLKYFSRQP